MFWDVERKKASDLDDYITEGYLCYLYIYLLKIQDQIQIINGIQKKNLWKSAIKKNNGNHSDIKMQVITKNSDYNKCSNFHYD